MNPEVQKRQFKFKPRNMLIIGLTAFIIVMFAITGQFLFSTLNNDKVYTGVYVNDTPVSNLTLAEMTSVLKKNYQDRMDNITIAVSAGNVKETLSAKDVNAAYDIQSTAEKAYAIGRKGNIFQRLGEILDTKKKNVHLSMVVTYDKDKVAAFADSLYQKTYQAVKEHSLEVGTRDVKLLSGHHGESIDKNKLITEIETRLSSSNPAAITIPIINTEPQKMDVDVYLSKIDLSPVNAKGSYVNRTFKVIPHANGRKMDRQLLADALTELQAREDSEKIVPFTILQPEITTDIFKKKIFTSTLGKMETSFATSTANRGENIRIAASKINGYIVLPGEEFSFNKVVGNRTAANGFKEAHAYSNGKIIDSIGGGICQVSSTLYNAVLLSDMKIVERRSHSMTVSYLPYGTDAAVSYGSVDFKFQNSSRWPIRVETQVTPDHKIFFTVVGTEEEPGKTIEIVPKIIKTIDYSVKYINDPNLEEGKTVIVQKGMKGYVVDTYKVVKQNGKVVSESKLHTSTYKPYTQQVRRGTKKVVKPATPVQPDTKPAESGSTTEVKDPGNTNTETTTPPQNTETIIDPDPGEIPVEEVPVAETPASSDPSAASTESTQN